MNGALLIDKPAGVTSFGVVDQIKTELVRAGFAAKKRDVRIGHGGTLDPFATGLLVVFLGKACRAARYFLGGTKSYEGTIVFGHETDTGDGTGTTGATTDKRPESLERLCAIARQMTEHDYLQTPPMFSAKKVGGKPLYELARAGQEVEREMKTCRLFEFRVESFDGQNCTFALACTSGTYVRTLAQDFARLAGSLGTLVTLKRTASGPLSLENARSLPATLESIRSKMAIETLEHWTAFDELLRGLSRCEISQDEAHSLKHGNQRPLLDISRRALDNSPMSVVSETRAESGLLALYQAKRLFGVAVRSGPAWKLETVFG